MQVSLWPEIRGRCSSEVRATCFQREPLPGQQWRGLAGKAEEEVKRREQGERAPAAGKPQMMVVMMITVMMVLVMMVVVMVVNKVKELQRQESHSPVIVRRHAGKNCNRRTNHGDERRDGVRNISQMLREEKTEENSVDEKNNKEEEAARRPVSFSLDSEVVNKHMSLRLVKSAVSAESTELKKPCFLSSLCSSETKAIGNQPNQELAKDDICKESGIQVTRKDILDSPEKIADIKLKLENVKDLLDLTENQDREGIIAQRDVTGAELKMSSPKGDRKPFFAAAF